MQHFQPRVAHNAWMSTAALKKGRGVIERLTLAPAEVFEELPGFDPSTHVSPFGVSAHGGTSE